MIGLDAFRERMKTEIEKTKNIKSVQVMGKSLDDALHQATIELGLPLRILDYEILDRGHGGFLGFKATPWRIIAYESVGEIAEEVEKSLEEELDLQSYEQQDIDQTIDVNGQYSVRLASDGAWLKVFPAVGDGLPGDYRGCCCHPSRSRCFGTEYAVCHRSGEAIGCHLGKSRRFHLQPGQRRTLLSGSFRRRNESVHQSI